MSQDAAQLEAEGKEKPESTDEFDLVGEIVRKLQPLSVEDQRHVLATVTTWLRIPVTSRHDQRSRERSRHDMVVGHSVANDEYRFSDRADVTPKDFLLEKDPNTDGERLACLAYYLTHYRNHPHFKTEDLSRLNTEAAQRRFANAAFTAKNAMRDGFFVQAPKKGFRQLSAVGEQYVQALPDHEAAQGVRKRIHGRRGRSNSSRRSRPEQSDTQA